MKKTLSILGLSALAITSSQAITLIGNGISNGSFEFLAGATGSGAHAGNWDTDGDGDVDNWTVYTGAGYSGPNGDSGTDASGDATDGTRTAFLQDDNRTFNDTDIAHVIAEGDVIDFSFQNVRGGRGEAQAQLAYWDGSDATTVVLFGSAVAGSPIGTYSGSYTVLATDTFIGQTLTLTLQSNGDYPELDQASLVVTPVPEPTSSALLGLGGLALILRRRK